MDAQIYGRSEIGSSTRLGPGVIVGHPGKPHTPEMDPKAWEDLPGARIGADCVLRAYTIIYSEAELGDAVQTGHRAVVREASKVGHGTLVGTGVVIEDHCKVGADVSLQSNVYIPTHSVIEDDVFIGPCATLTNDSRMARGDVELEGVRIERAARIGANCTILPGVTIGEDSVVGAGAVVTEDVQPHEIVAGVPARSIGEVAEEDRLP